MFRQINKRLWLDLHTIRGAQKKTGVRVSHCSTADSCALQVRQTCLGRTKVVDTSRRRKDLRTETLPPQVATDFVGMVILHPRQAGGCSRLFGEQRVPVRRAHILHSALGVTQAGKVWE